MQKLTETLVLAGSDVQQTSEKRKAVFGHPLDWCLGAAAEKKLEKVEQDVDTAVGGKMDD